MFHHLATNLNAYIRHTQRQDPLSELEIAVLDVLSGQELHSLDIRTALPQTVQPKLSPCSYSLYAVLYQLEQRGFVRSRMSAENLEHRGGNRRKYYQLADQDWAKVQARLPADPINGRLKKATIPTVPVFAWAYPRLS